MPIRYIDYRVGAFDSLESIAEKFLGDANQWQTLALVNHLRAPFISNAPRDQYSVSRIADILTSPIPAGSQSAHIPVQSPALIRQGSIFYLEHVDVNGQTISEAIEVADYDPSVSIVSFVPEYNNGNGTIYSWPIDHSFEVFDDPAFYDTFVLRYGDVIHIPSTVPLGSEVSGVRDEKFLDLLGTDILVDDAGFFSYSSSGDLATVAGHDNVRQACRDRLGTPLGELVYHPEYGNGIFAYIGVPNNPLLKLIAEGMNKRAVTADPRVASVPVFTAAIDGNVLSTSMSIIEKISSELVQGVESNFVISR